MKRMRFLSLILILAVLLSAFSIEFTAAGPVEPRQRTATSVELVSEAPAASAKIRAANGEEWVSVIVKLSDAPLATYTGNMLGLAATSPKVTGEEKLDVASAESQTYLKYIDARQDMFVAAAQAAIPGAKVTHRYDVILGGVAMVVPESQLDTLAKLPNVENVYFDQVAQVDTDRSPAFVGATKLWQELGGKSEAGEGVVVGILDTGIWPEHPSFSDPDPSGNPYPAPPGGPYACDFGNTAWNPNDVPFTCNNKLIGAYTFLDTYKATIGLIPYDPVTNLGEYDSARDDDGHGTHTSSTAAGNYGVNSILLGVPRGKVSGIAPRAHVIMYRVCALEGCYFTDSAAAMQQAIIDGVDAVNFSIGGGTNPYSEAPDLAFLDAYEAGVFVAVSAGNSGPGPNTVGHRGPWVTTVAASTHDRTFAADVTLTADNGDALVLDGASITGGYTGDVVLAADYGDALCLAPFAPGTFSGEIVVCERGIIARVTKSFNVAEGGAGGMILYNPALQGVSTDPHYVPSIHLENDAGVALLDFIATHTGVVGTLSGGVKAKTQGDVMAAFSSRGGPAQALGVSKPDVTAPGVQILAGETPLGVEQGVGGMGPQGELFQAIQGTSMSSPHVAGAAALLKDLHPDWTPGQIKSALMTTAKVSKVYKEDAVTPADAYDYGSGRIELRKAGDPGITFDETGANYRALETELWHANYPSVYHPNMPGRITLQRTARDVTGADNTWSLWTSKDQTDWRIIVPSTLFVPADGEATFDITIDAGRVPLGEVRFGMIKLTDGTRVLHMPVTIVRGEPAVTMTKACDPAVLAKNETTDCTITIENTGFEDATVSMTDHLPGKLRLVAGSVVGGDPDGNGVKFDGTLAGAGLPAVDVDADALYGYLPLAAFGVTPTPCPSNCDDGGWTITGLDINYLGQNYTDAIWSVNGTLELGTASGVATSFANQNFPDPAIPDNLLAPWWTDLNLGAGGNWYIGALTDGVSVWDIFEWENVPRYGDAGSTFSFQIWLERGSGNIHFTYGSYAGDTGDATVGAENDDGTVGDTWYYDGAGTLPWGGSDLGVFSVPGTPGETHIVTFSATGRHVGAWTNCAEMTGDTFFGTNIACFSGEVTAP